MTTTSRIHLQALPLVAAAALLVANPAPTLSQVVYQGLRTFCFVELSSASPSGPLTEGTNGALYGVSLGGGQTEDGTLFRLNKDGSGFAILRSFTGTNGDGTGPAGGLLLASNGLLFGTTFSGGYSNVGTVFRTGQDGSNYTVIKTFTGNAGDGASPSCTLMQAGNGALYGTTSAGGDYNMGTVFRINGDGSGYLVLKSFAGGTGDGAQPHGALVQGTNGMLLGTTALGGTSNQGTIFTLDLEGNGYQIISSFGGALGDGAQPYAGPVQGSDAALYGTTMHGGFTNQGTAFRLFQDGSGYQVIRRFTGSDGANPLAPLIFGTNGMLYGTTFNGGAYANGTVFEVDPATSAYRVIKSYQASGQDGAQPVAALVQASDGALYGATGFGGLGSQGTGTGQGTAFTLNLDGSGYTVIWNFSGAGRWGESRGAVGASHQRLPLWHDPERGRLRPRGGIQDKPGR
jgi:uncharacterized repeat protein (TIGR03803 family)